RSEVYALKHVANLLLVNGRHRLDGHVQHVLQERDDHLNLGRHAWTEQRHVRIILEGDFRQVDLQVRVEPPVHGVRKVADLAHLASQVQVWECIYAHEGRKLLVDLVDPGLVDLNIDRHGSDIGQIEEELV